MYNKGNANNMAIATSRRREGYLEAAFTMGVSRYLK
jgi:hypothetical protein